MKSLLVVKLPFLLSLIFLLPACAQYSNLPPGTVKEIHSAIIERELVSVPSVEATAQVANFDYRVGPGDVLAIHIPGLEDDPGVKFDSGSKVDSGQQSQAVSRYRVYGSGKILLPLVGPVKVGGLTIEEIQDRLSEVVRPVVRKPVIAVEIIEYKSQPLYLLGKFKSPGVSYLDRPINIIQGIVLGGGLEDAANLRGGRLIRDKKIMAVDIYDLLYNNDLSQNIQLLGGDTIYIPGNGQQNVFIFGAVERQGPISMLNGRINLPQALSSAGLADGHYEHRHIRIIRSHTPTHGELLVVDLARTMAGEVMPLPLQDGDIIYVPRTGIGNWNQALNDMLPTLQAFSAVLQPFVQIKYLRQ